MYATLQDMIDSFGEEELVRLTDTNDAPGVIDQAALARALERASVEVDGYVAHNYPKPFDPLPRLLVGLACDIARYLLSGQGGRLTSDQVTARYKDAVAMLKMIARGEVKIGVDTEGDVVRSRAGVLVRTGGASGHLADALQDYPA